MDKIEPENNSDDYRKTEEKMIPKDPIKIENAQWMGDALTGYRSFEVLWKILEDNHKVIRRYSNFLAFRNKIVSLYPEWIIPTIPEKSLTEKVTNDDNEKTK